MKAFRIIYTDNQNKTLTGIIDAKNEASAQLILETYPNYQTTINIIELKGWSESLFQFSELSVNSQSQALRDLDKENHKAIKNGCQYLTYNETLHKLKTNGLFTITGHIS